VWVTIGSGEGEGLSVKVEGERFLVGSGRECGLMLPGPGIEPLHAFFQVREDGVVELHDLGTESGTFVDGERVEGSARIRGGELIEIGDTVLRASVEEPSEEARLLREGEAGGGPAEPAAAVRVATGGETVEVVPARERRRLLRVTRRATVLAGGALALAAIAVVVALVVGGGDDEKSVAVIVRDATPQTVLVGARAQGVRGESGGSGVVVDGSNGLILTNFHVVNGGTQFKIGFQEDLRDARLIAAAPCDDLALLKVADTDGMKTMALSSQGDLKQGDQVVALGFPANASLQSKLTSTAGTVSVVKSAFRLPDPAAAPLENTVQIDAALSPGNSGGPLVDKHGRLVGVNTAIVTQIEGAPVQGQGYAIGVDRVKEVLGDLAAGRSRGWAGFGLQVPSQAFLEQRKLPEGIVSGLPVPGTEAERASISGVLITNIDGKPLAASMTSYCNAARGIRSGQTAALTIVPRPGAKAQTLQVPFD
jgi:S1-C subfamily serine protease